MTPIPTWEELVERLANVLGEQHDRGTWEDRSEGDREGWRVAAENVLRLTLGLTPEILEDARAVAWDIKALEKRAEEYDAANFHLARLGLQFLRQAEEAEAKVKQAEDMRLEAEVKRLREAAEAYRDLTKHYRLGMQPSDKLFERLERALASVTPDLWMDLAREDVRAVLAHVHPQPREEP